MAMASLPSLRSTALIADRLERRRRSDTDRPMPGGVRNGMAINALTDSNAVDLIQAASLTRYSARDTALVAVLLDAGPSRAELVRTRVIDYDPIHGVLQLGSGAKRRAVRLGEAAIDALRDTRSSTGSDALIAAADGRPITARTVHEQLLTIGVLAGLGDSVTCRRTRRTYHAAIANAYDIPTVMRLLGHGSKRRPAADLETALAAQFASGWQSPLDLALEVSRHRQAA